MKAYDNLVAMHAQAEYDGHGSVTIGMLDLTAILAEVDKLRAAAPVKKTRAKKATAPAAGAGDALPDWLPLEAWQAFLDMRKKIKKPATDYAQKLLIKKLGAFHANEMDPAAILNQSIMNGWQDLYALKDQGVARGFDSSSGRQVRVGRPSTADMNAANNAEALRLLDRPNFDPDDGMTIEAAR